MVLERDYSNAMAVLKIIYLQKITIHATKINCKGSPDNGVLFSVIFGTDCPMSQVLSSAKEEKILKGSLDSIPSPSPSVKIQIMGGKVCLRSKGKTLLGIFNKIFAEVEGNWIKSRLPFKFFSTLTVFNAKLDINGQKGCRIDYLL